MRRIPGSHEPNAKNRSSKHLGWFTKIKPAVRSMSGDMLRKLGADRDAQRELNRRADKRAKRESKAA